MAGKLLIGGLVNQRARLSGERRRLQRMLRALEMDIAAIDRSLRVCGYEEDPSQITSIEGQKAVFKRGELKRFVLRTLRAGPLPAEDLADLFMEEKGWAVTDALAAEVEKRLKMSLQRCRTARSRTSREYLGRCVFSVMAPSSQELEPPGLPGRFIPMDQPVRTRQCEISTHPIGEPDPARLYRQPEVIGDALTEFTLRSHVI